MQYAAFLAEQSDAVRLLLMNLSVAVADECTRQIIYVDAHCTTEWIKKIDSNVLLVKIGKKLYSVWTLISSQVCTVGLRAIDVSPSNCCWH